MIALRHRSCQSSWVVINLLVAGFFTYFLSQTVDQRWWRIIPGENHCECIPGRNPGIAGTWNDRFRRGVMQKNNDAGIRMPMPTAGKPKVIDWSAGYRPIVHEVLNFSRHRR